MDFLYNNFLSEFFVWCLNGLESLAGVFAVAIILLTILIRLALLPLDLKQRSNQEKMAALGPQLNSLKKRYANNPQQLQRKTQELYRSMNVRPMLGCLPMLFQLPILFAFFGAMSIMASEQTVALILNAAQFGPETVELPQFLWVHNFWQPDSGISPILPSADEFLQFVQRNINYISAETMSLLQSQDILSYTGNIVTVNAAEYETLARGIIEANGVEYVQNADGGMIPAVNNGWFILPAMSGAALFLQQKFAPQSAMNMSAGNPEQEQAQGCSSKVMLWFFPIFSIYICATSNTAFALYWFTSSMYAFAQSRVITYVKKKRAEKRQLTVKGA